MRKLLEEARGKLQEARSYLEDFGVGEGQFLWPTIARIDAALAQPVPTESAEDMVRKLRKGPVTKIYHYTDSDAARMLEEWRQGK